MKDGSIRLAWSAFSDDELTSKVEYINGAEAASLGIPYDLLLDAFLEGGGASLGNNIASFI